MVFYGLKKIGESSTILGFDSKVNRDEWVGVKENDVEKSTIGFRDVKKTLKVKSKQQIAIGKNGECSAKL